jgi:PAS domain S-box-containing protein
MAVIGRPRAAEDGLDGSLPFQAVAAMPVALLELDHRGIVRSAAGGALAMRPADLVGRSIWELIESVEGAHHVRQALAGHEVSGTAPWGGRLWHASHQPLRTDGRVTGIAAVFVDVTDLVGTAGPPGAAADLAPLEAAVQAADVAIVVTGTDGRVTWSNPASSRLLGRPLPAGTAVEEGLDPARAAQVLTQIANRPPNRTDQYELRLQDAEGGCRWVRVSASALHAADGEPLGSVAVLTDITAAKDLERRLATATRTVEQLQEALDSRVVIEQAKGVLAVRRALSVDDSFQVLLKHARDHNARIHDVARAVVHDGLDL